MREKIIMIFNKGIPITKPVEGWRVRRVSRLDQIFFKGPPGIFKKLVNIFLDAFFEMLFSFLFFMIQKNLFNKHRNSNKYGNKFSNPIDASFCPLARSGFSLGEPGSHR